MESCGAVWDLYKSGEMEESQDRDFLLIWWKERDKLERTEETTEHSHPLSIHIARERESVEHVMETEKTT